MSAHVKREFEKYLRAAGASKTDALRAVSALPLTTMHKLLPAWRRVRAAWRARHG